METLDRDRFMRFFIANLEMDRRLRFPVCSQFAGKRIGQSCIIMDLEGFEMKYFNNNTRVFMQFFA